MRSSKVKEFSFFASNRYKYVLSIALGLFLFVFMAFFLPFGISNYNPNHQYTFEFFGVLSIFMLATIIMALLNEFFLKPLLVRHFTAKSFLLWSVWLLVILGLTNFFVYNLLGDWHDFSLLSAIDFTFNCATVFVFPLAGTLFYFRFQNLKSQLENVSKESFQKYDERQFLHFNGEGSNDRITISLADFLYAKAQDNYVSLCYVSNKELKRELIRSSMKQLLENVDSDLIVRCHRSYSVNLYNVQSFRQRKNPEIQLKYIKYSIPVSKSYQPEILTRLNPSDRN